MNDIVNEYQIISDERIASLVLIEAIFLGISCIVFILELAVIGPFIIRAVLRTRNELLEEPENMMGTKKYKIMKKGLFLLVFLPSLAAFIYLASVSSVAIATVLGQSLIQITLDAHAGDGARINVSGRQRMLSQRVVLDTMVFLTLTL
jgi:hypothetical protein